MVKGGENFLGWGWGRKEEEFMNREVGEEWGENEENTTQDFLKDGE